MLIAGYGVSPVLSPHFSARFRILADKWKEG
jgi:hypothetical protein